MCENTLHVNPKCLMKWSTVYGCWRLAHQVLEETSELFGETSKFEEVFRHLRIVFVHRRICKPIQCLDVLLLILYVSLRHTETVCSFTIHIYLLYTNVCLMIRDTSCIFQMLPYEAHLFLTHFCLTLLQCFIRSWANSCHVGLFHSYRLQKNILPSLWPECCRK